MNGKLRRRKRWFRALEIAEILFEYEAYDTAYLRDLETFLEEEGMYSPKIKEDLVEKLYHKAKAENMTMTKLVNQIIRDALSGQRPARTKKRNRGCGTEIQR